MEKRGRRRISFYQMRVRGTAQIDGQLIQAGVARHAFEEYIAALNFTATPYTLTADVIRSHWPAFVWSHPSAGFFHAETNISASAALMLPLPLQPFIDGAGVMVFPQVGAGVNSLSQTWQLGIDCYRFDGTPYEPGDFSIVAQVRAYM